MPVVRCITVMYECTQVCVSCMIMSVVSYICVAVHIFRFMICVFSVGLQLCILMEITVCREAVCWLLACLLA